MAVSGDHVVSIGGQSDLQKDVIAGVSVDSFNHLFRNYDLAEVL